MPVITFSVSQGVYDKIKGAAAGSESGNLCAKRIVVAALGGNPPIPIPRSELEDLKARLDVLERGLMVLAQSRNKRSKTPTE